MPLPTRLADDRETDLERRIKAAEARVAELETAVEEALRELGSATLANSPAVRATIALLRVALKR